MSRSVHEVEWVAVPEEVGIRQGDLLIRRHPRTLSIEDRLLAITADCDFAKTKSGGALAALRVIPLAEYVHVHWTRKFSAKLVKEQGELINSFNGVLINDCGRVQSLSSEAILSWIGRKSGAQICHELGLINGKKLLLIISKLSALQEFQQNLGSPDCFEKLCAYFELRDNKDKAIAREVVMSKVRNELASLPEDVFLLSSLGPDIKEPHIVLLRNIVFVALDQATTSAEKSRAEDLYLRFCRLAPTFKYAISQQFGLLYSRIGLPNAYDDHKKYIAENFKC